MGKILSFNSEKSTFFLRYFIFFFVNGIFIIKYGSEHFSDLQASAFLFLYIIVFSGFIFLVKKIILKDSVFKILFWLIVPLFFLCTIYINRTVDSQNLMTDRWAAMEISINAILRGEYPYNIVDFQGNESSNLPVLVLLGMPFYLLFGSVGYLQCFVFVVFSLIVLKFFKNYRERVVAISLLIFSPSYLYEIYTKSDLFSNFIIAVGAILFLWKYFIKSTKLRYEYVAIIAALLLLTRIPILFPLMILLLRKVYFLSFRQKFIFGSVLILTTIPFLIWFFLPAESWELIKYHNPFQLQSKQPVFFSFFFFTLAGILSFKVKNVRNVLDYSSFVLFFSVMSVFLLMIYWYGLKSVFFESGFDISYFNVAMPSIILSLPLNNSILGKEALLKI
ncbi:MAG TPA: hypothetical protein PK041_04395 [Kaistella sp.]|nr:hypothetical protein [Kaistella sp.]